MIAETMKNSVRILSGAEIAEAVKREVAEEIKIWITVRV